MSISWIVSGPAQLITAPAQPPASRVVLYTAMFPADGSMAIALDNQFLGSQVEKDTIEMCPPAVQFIEAEYLKKVVSPHLLSPTLRPNVGNLPPRLSFDSSLFVQNFKIYALGSARMESYFIQLS